MPMRKIRRDDLLSLEAYERVRPGRRAALLEAKKPRRVQLGTLVSLVFENRDSMIYQIQEMCRIERIAEERKVAEEIETYNELVPDAGELRATLMIEVTDRAAMDRELSRLVGIEHCVWLVDGGRRIHAVPLEPRERADRTSAVHFLRFPAGSLGPGARLEIDHPEYSAATPLSPQTIESLGRDLRED
jgi:hypothetical protein